jgi:hypothetical protein
MLNTLFQALVWNQGLRSNNSELFLRKNAKKPCMVGECTYQSALTSDTAQ